MIKTIDAVLSLVPNAGCVITDGEIVLWESDEQQPTKSEITAELARLQADYDAKEYQRNRAKEYPSLADFADAYYWSQQGDDTKMTAYIEKCEAVKTKYPKV